MPRRISPRLTRVFLLGLALLLAGCTEHVNLARMGLDGGDHYRVSGRQVFWISYSAPASTFNVRRSETRLMADAATFEVLADEAYARDAHRVFYRGAWLEDAHAGSFRIIQVARLAIRSADPVEPGYALDRARVWTQGQLLDGAQAATFQWLGRRYARDAATVFLGPERLPDADPATFRVLPGELDLAADTRTVWVNGLPVRASDPAAVRGLGGAYWTDGRAIYWLTEALIGAEVASFRVPSGMQYGEDAGGRWQGPQRANR